MVQRREIVTVHALQSRSVTGTTAGGGPQGEAIVGSLLIVLAFLCVAVMSAFGKAAAGVPTAVVVLFQSGISLFLLLPWALRHGIGELRTTRLPLHIVRALSGLLSQALFFLAVKHMALVDAVLLVNAAPLFIPFVALLWMKTPITPIVGAGLVIGFVGVLLILRPSSALLTNPSALLAIGAALCSAIALVSVNWLSSTDKPDVILFYYFLISTVAASPFAIYGWQMPAGIDALAVPFPSLSADHPARGTRSGTDTGTPTGRNNRLDRVICEIQRIGRRNALLSFDTSVFGRE
jgi:drug/metabolite transporter (DMT)-like permease